MESHALTGWKHRRIFYQRILQKPVFSQKTGFYGEDSVNETRVPPPGAFSALIVPPCASTKYFAIESPSPIPPESLDL